MIRRKLCSINVMIVIEKNEVAAWYLSRHVHFFTIYHLHIPFFTQIKILILWSYIKKKLFWIKLSRSCYTKNKRRSIFKSNRHEEQPPQVHTQITHVYVCVPLQPHQCAWFGEPSVRSGAAVDPPRGLGPALSASRFHFWNFRTLERYFWIPIRDCFCFLIALFICNLRNLGFLFWISNRKLFWSGVWWSLLFEFKGNSLLL